MLRFWLPFLSGIGKRMEVEKKSVISFDVSSDDAFIAAGTAQVVEDAFLLFWDIRYTHYNLF